MIITMILVMVIMTIMIIVIMILLMIKDDPRLWSWFPISVFDWDPDDPVDRRPAVTDNHDDDDDDDDDYDDDDDDDDDYDDDDDDHKNDYDTSSVHIRIACCMILVPFFHQTTPNLQPHTWCFYVQPTPALIFTEIFGYNEIW